MHSIAEIDNPLIRANQQAGILCGMKVIQRPRTWTEIAEGHQSSCTNSQMTSKSLDR